MSTPQSPPPRSYSPYAPLPPSKIASTKLLVIGAGGIGCELLKNLSLSSFPSIDVVDLDTIDVSNLNRQFLFRKHHVGKPKCVIACEAARKMSPLPSPPKLTPHHGKVQDFSVSFFKGFNVVLNALDNVDARRYVNRMCLAASVPLIEAGSTGYLGQCTVIDKKSGVECYECQSKPTPKVYPICTIRSTPSQPVHCIVWAKELFKLLFGSNVEESMLWEDPDGEEGSVYMTAVVTNKPTFSSPTTTTTTTTTTTPEEKRAIVRSYAKNMLVALYNTEITKQIKMDRYKTATKTPQPLPLSLIDEGLSSPPTLPLPQKTILSPRDSISHFHRSLSTLLLSSPHPPPSEFDKDDSSIMTLVTAASNLRSHVFSLPLQTPHDAKGIAGNIIPAIATTNAIIAGLQVLQLYRILHDDDDAPEKQKIKEKCRYVYCLRDKTRRGNYVQPTSLPEPNENCFVCRDATLELRLNVAKWTFDAFLKRVVKGRLGFGEPSVLIGGDLIYEEGEDADGDCFEVNLGKLLKDLPCGGVRDGGILRIEDFSQCLEVDCVIVDKDVFVGGDGGDGDDDEGGGEEKEIGFDVVGAEELKVRETTGAGGGSATTNGHDAEKEKEGDKGKDDDESDIEIVEAPENDDDKGTKRKIDNVVDEKDDSNNNEESRKKRKIETTTPITNNDDIIEISD